MKNPLEKILNNPLFRKAALNALKGAFSDTVTTISIRKEGDGFTFYTFDKDNKKTGEYKANI